MSFQLKFDLENEGQGIAKTCSILCQIRQNAKAAGAEPRPPNPGAQDRGAGGAFPPPLKTMGASNTFASPTKMAQTVSGTMKRLKTYLTKRF